jgi:plasmid stabilization system protein ParE
VQNWRKSTPNIPLPKDGIVDYCESLSSFPLRGQCREDIRPGLRTTNYKKRTIIAFSVTETQVSILGIYYGGQSFEDRLGE